MKTVEGATRGLLESLKITHARSVYSDTEDQRRDRAAHIELLESQLPVAEPEHAQDA